MMDIDTIKTEEDEQPANNTTIDDEITVQEVVPIIESVDLTEHDNSKEEEELKEENGEVEKETVEVPETFSWRTTRSDNRIKKEFKCQVCPKTFSIQSCYEEHKNSHILTSRELYADSYPCTQCNKKFPTKTGLLNHMRLHIDNKKRTYTCAICEQTFKTNKELIQHKTEHTDVTFRCAYAKRCSDLTFTDHYEYLLHGLTHNKRPKPKCFECGTYIQSGYMKQHLRTHYDQGLKCSKCGVKCTNEQYLKVHMRHHDKEIKCVECGKLFGAKNDHDRHMRTHTQVKTIQCLYCGKGFHTAQQRDIHTRMHTGEKPFSCDICGHKSRQRVDASRHRNTHFREAGDKAFQCDYCQMRFISKATILGHIRNHTKSRGFKCPDCPFVTVTKTGLRHHIAYKHLDARPFSCKICNVGFKSKKDLERHKMCKMHRNNEYGAMKSETKDEY